MTGAAATQNVTEMRNVTEIPNVIEIFNDTEMPNDSPAETEAFDINTVSEFVIFKK